MLLTLQLCHYNAKVTHFDYIRYKNNSFSDGLNDRE